MVNNDMLDINLAPYSRIEYERRFLVASDFNWRPLVRTYSKLIADKYLHNTRLRLRLRLLSDSNSKRQIIKLNKKEQSDSPYYCTISRLILSQAEYQLLNQLAGDQIKKRRYYYHDRELVYAIDVFEDQLAGLILSEIEADDLKTLMSIPAPVYAICEVTNDPFFSGGNLCGIDHSQLLAKLTTLSAI